MVGFKNESETRTGGARDVISNSVVSCLTDNYAHYRLYLQRLFYSFRFGLAGDPIEGRKGGGTMDCRGELISSIDKHQIYA